MEMLIEIIFDVLFLSVSTKYLVSFVLIISLVSISNEFANDLKKSKDKQLQRFLGTS